MQIDNPVEAALQLVKLVFVDPLIVMVTSLISSYENVAVRCRENNKKLSTFVPRVVYLLSSAHSEVSPSSQIGEVLAIALLNKEMLEEGTLTTSKLQLIAHAESGAEDQ